MLSAANSKGMLHLIEHQPGKKPLLSYQHKFFEAIVSCFSIDKHVITMLGLT